MLSKLDLLEVYDSSEHDLIGELQVPLLSNSNCYLRGVGYFSSGWLRLASQGLIRHIENGGTSRIIVSPILDPRDWEALKSGDAAAQEDALFRVLNISLEELALRLDTDTLNALAWMVADNLLEFRFAVERSRDGGDYHDKVGVFTDAEGSAVAIHGSFNDSIKATMNGEAFSVFRSWVPGQEPFVKQHSRRLERLWEHGNAQFATYRIPDAIRENIVRLRQTASPPYKVPDAEPAAHDGLNPAFGGAIVLRDFQDLAVGKWREAGYRGILEMATGTGKTITALSAARAAVSERGARFIVILVPYLHLMEQWGENARKFGLKPHYCSGENQDWPRRLRSSLMDASTPGSQPSCVIAVHQTAATERFTRCVSRAAGDKLLLIADEVHGLGARHLRNALYDGAAFRLGLSATPDRWFDEDGTKFLKDYFAGVCYELPLEKAIGTILTPYRYYPQIVTLDDDEHAAYAILSRQIAAAMTASKNAADERVKSLLLRRARIVSSARQKLPMLLDIVQRLQGEAQKGGHEIRDILVYAPAGQHKEYLLALSNLGLRCHEFVHDVSLKRREEVLQQFSSGQIQVLVAIKCLDEGVDVPSTRTAFILASSTNPREFVQRRGRILRRFEGKERADAYDFLVMPSAKTAPGGDEGNRGLLRREMPRFAEFSSSAINQFDARSVVRPTLDAFEMLPLLDKRPWEVYKELRTSEWEIENEQ